jgi:hypothetical protein
MIKSYTVLGGIPKVGDYLGDFAIDGRIILK